MVRGSEGKKKKSKSLFPEEKPCGSGAWPMPVDPIFQPRRRTPAKGVHISYCGANWVFLTVCTD